MVKKIMQGVGLLLFMTLLPVNLNAQTKYETVVFAGGCFWCMQPPFEKLEGVVKVIVGYAGGPGKNPTYDNYAKKGHIEAIEVSYDPAKVSYPQLLEVFWRQINPADGDGQFCDRGPQYRSAIFYNNKGQEKLALNSKGELDKSGRFDKPVITEIIPSSKFYPAEEYHQAYYKKNPIRYKFYRLNCGRDQYLKKAWANAAGNSGGQKNVPGHSQYDKEGLKARLTPLQYKVTQKNGTERAFDNEYWDNKAEGIYVDIVSGEPLFSSIGKYDSGTGWPSFSRPLEQKNIIERTDKSFFITRIEARSARADSHLGHIFRDGPKPTGLRYCINSAALRFIPKEDLEKEGYAEFKKLFDK